MNSFKEPTEDRPLGLSRRQLLCRLAGGYAGALLSSAGLVGGTSYAASPGPLSLRDLLGRISANGCDASQGIRRLLPNDHPVISIRDVARRNAGNVVNLCRGPRISVRTQQHRLGGYIFIDGDNFTPGGRIHMQLEGIPDFQGAYSIGSADAQSDGTLRGYVWDARCGPPGTGTVTVRAIDVQRGQSATGTTSALSCPPP
jgi:hypothetical protein